MDPTNNERHCLGAITHNYPSCIGIIDSVLVEIGRMWKNVLHSTWFNMEDTFYCINNTVIVSYDGLFMHIDVGYPGSFHNGIILRHFQFCHEWLIIFTNTDDHFKYLWRHLGYKCKDMFIMHWTCVHNIHSNVDDLALKS